MTDQNPTQETLHAEYTAAQYDYMHNDNFSWQIGGVLLAGVFVYWGLIASTRLVTPSVVGISSFLVTLLMSLWILYTHHYRQTYLCKLHRMHEIERTLGMKLHTRWMEIVPGEDETYYHTFGLSGHRMNLLIYCCTSFGGTLAGFFIMGPSTWLLAPVPVVGLVLIWIGRNERSIKSLLKRRIESRQASDDAKQSSA